jgi:hypothetical protein
MDQTRSEYGRRLDRIHARIEARIGEKPLVFYSAYPIEGTDLAVDNLDEIAVEGSVQFFAEHDPFFGEGTAYTSPIVNSPTWLEVAALAHEMIKTTGTCIISFWKASQWSERQAI